MSESEWQSRPYPEPLNDEAMRREEAVAGLVDVIRDEIARQAAENGDYYEHPLHYFNDKNQFYLKPNIIAHDGTIDLAKIADAVVTKLMSKT